MKKILAFMMCSILTAGLLAGCGGGTEQKDVSASVAPAAENVGEESSGAETEDSLIKDFDGETIVVGLYCGDDSVTGKNRIFEKINEYYMENYNINVQFVTALMSDYAQSMNMMLSSGEQLDIFCSGMMGFSNTVANESTYDLYQDDLINLYGKDIIELIDPVFLKGCVVNGACVESPVCVIWQQVCGVSYLTGSIWMVLDMIFQISTRRNAILPLQKI